MAIHCFGGCKGFTRIVILGVNVFFLGAGLLIIILASVALGKAQQFEDQSSIFTYMATAVSSAILVATGVGTVVTAILGFFGRRFQVDNLVEDLHNHYVSDVHSPAFDRNFLIHSRYQQTMRGLLVRSHS